MPEASVAASKRASHPLEEWEGRAALRGSCICEADAVPTPSMGTYSLRAILCVGAWSTCLIQLRAMRRSHIWIMCLLVLSRGVPMPIEATVAAATTSGNVDSVVNTAAGDFFKNSPQAVGLSVAVLINGKAHFYNYGSREKGGHQKPAADSLYAIASISKTFTGTLLAQAQLEGRASLKDDVRKFLPGEYPNLAFNGHPIRLQDLVNHLSGLPFNLPDVPGNRPPFDGPTPPDLQSRLDHYTRADFLADLHTVKLDRVPGETFSYSNVGAVLASLVLERIYGKPYEELVKQKIGAPLGMTDTTISLSASQRKRLMTGYDEAGHATPYPQEMLLGAGALKSTTADMLKYAQWEMAESDPAVRLSHQATFTSKNYSAGLNWQMITVGDARRIWQEGDLPGFASICAVFPEAHLAIVTLVNEEDHKSSHQLTLMTNRIVTELSPASANLF